MQTFSGAAPELAAARQTDWEGRADPALLILRLPKETDSSADEGRDAA
jgi:hypothetical protein